MTLANFDIDLFLRDYWQKKPLLIRGAFPDWSNPLEPDELAGLACEEEVESRLITGTDGAWRMERGPIPAKRFGKLGKRHWTLLVQAVDHHVPAVAALLAPFRFVPDWRIDDVMVSYATDEGGVGPHYDQYDVFLLQGLGRRRWQVGAPCDATAPLLPHEDLRLLADFQPTDEWVLEPGDILYVPPFVPHDGVAVGEDCMTYSIGFRAPLRSELIAHWCDHLLAEMPADARYEDPDLRRQDNPGEITDAALDRLHAMVTQALGDRAAFARWFGAYNSTPKYAEADWAPEAPVDAEEISDLIAQGFPLRRNPASRFSFVREGEGVILFVDGESFDCMGETALLAERLCAADLIEIDRAANPASLALLAALIDQGSAMFDEADEED